MSAELQANPLYTGRSLPNFDEIKVEHMEPAMRQVLADIESGFERLEATVEPTWQSAVAALDELMIPLHHAWGPIAHLNAVMSSPELREVREAMQPLVVTLSLRIGQSKPLHDAMVALRESEEAQHLESWQLRVLDMRIRDAKHRGIGLEKEARKRFNEIAAALSQLSSQFADNLLDSRKEWHKDVTDPDAMRGVPESARRMLTRQWAAAQQDTVEADAENGPWRLTLDIPSFLAVMKHSPSRSLRESLLRAWIAVASEDPFDNRPLIREILQLRKEQALLLGYESWAALSLSEKMASIEEVYSLSETLRLAAWEPSLEEHRELQSFANEAGFDGELAKWDIPFWRERCKEARFSYTEEELKAYFPLDRVLSGLFSLVEELFEARVERAEEDIPVWHDDVRYYRLRDLEGREIAGFYLDPYSRPETKRSGAWMNICLSRRRKRDGTLQLPVAYLVCNATPPVDGQPAQMTFNEVTTLFHEFGHGLHHMLTQVDFEEISGVSGVEWDAVELPSQFMENWCFHRPTVEAMSAHVDTGSSLPEALFDKIVATRTYFAATDLLRQLHIGLTDIHLHDDFDPTSGEPMDVFFDVARKTQAVPPLTEDRFLCSFAHIFAGSYSAGYYSYKWAEVLSADAFEAFEEAGLDDREARRRMGRLFRDCILAKGGSEDPRDLYRAFRGRMADPNALLRQYGLPSESHS